MCSGQPSTRTAPAKRPRPQTSTRGEEDSDSEAEFDPESYYLMGEKDDSHEDVKTFITATFRKGLPKRKRLKALPHAELSVYKSTACGQGCGQYPGQGLSEIRQTPELHL